MDFHRHVLGKSREHISVQASVADGFFSSFFMPMINHLRDILALTKGAETKIQAQNSKKWAVLVNSIETNEEERGSHHSIGRKKKLKKLEQERFSASYRAYDRAYVHGDVHGRVHAYDHDDGRDHVLWSKIKRRKKISTILQWTRGKMIL